MYEGQFDYAELNELLCNLDAQLEDVRKTGCQAAKNERDYRIALASEMLRLRSEGIQVSILSDVCRGDERLAELKCARDCSEALYKASVEAINVSKLKIKTISSQIDREWRSQ